MFETHESSKIEIPSELIPPGIYAWTSISSRLQIRWFHVVYIMEQHDSLPHQTISFLLEVDQIIGLHQSENVEIIEVSIVSPGYLNKKGRWDMEPLEEIWLATEPGLDYEQPALIFVVKGGSRYVDSDLGTPEENLVNPELLFKI